MSPIRIESQPPVTTVVLSRPAARNAIDRPTAEALAAAFRGFDADDAAQVGVLWGDHGTFCAGADLKAVARGEPNRVAADGDGPLGPTRMRLSKPVIAAISGHAVAGGLELALWCDLRVMEADAVLGVFCRRFGVPLIDGGTARLPHIVGLGRALDLILTGRPVGADEALSMGLVDRVVEPGSARETAEQLARDIARFPATCMRSDRAAVYDGLGLPLADALRREYEHGLQALADPALVAGASRFSAGDGRGGAMD
ncbi:MAG: crotonase/enoyl-CoA hydratase family protein [Deltaproteobacteria bacterium]|nr:crotonase/enoyl-CoA hydratase family protein [Deltaproteobacteria bacterium]